jgi:hypothetical protein
VLAEAIILSGSSQSEKGFDAAKRPRKKLSFDHGSSIVIGETVAQVKGAKPRFKPAGKTSELTRQRVSELSEAYLEARNAKLRSQAFLAEAQAKEKAGELISRELVTRQAQYIFICLRQAILNFPTLYARRVVGIADERQAKAVLTKAAHEFLTELADFPEKCISPDWLQTLEGDGQGEGGKPLRPSSGQQIKAEAEKAKRRRKQKTAVMRKLRAKGQQGSRIYA